MRGVVLGGCAAVLVFDVAAAAASRAADIEYSWAIPGSVVIYSVTAFVASTVAGAVWAGAAAGATLGAVDATLGWALSWAIGPGAVEVDGSGWERVGAFAFTAVSVIALGAAVGLFAGAAARWWWRRQGAVAD